jgi:hypothetical protein
MLRIILVGLFLAFAWCPPGLADTVGDPFADLTKNQAPSSPATGSDLTASAGFMLLLHSDGAPRRGAEFLKRELMTQVSMSDREAADRPYLRQIFGFEYLRRFADAVAMVSSLNLQGRLVYRSDFLMTPADMEGEDRRNWFFEYHNAYLDVFNAFDSVLSPYHRRRHLGRFNARIGRFYLPFGLNLQTDTHATLLQLSNDRNFGFERDWYAGLWGSLNPTWSYDLYYLMGSGYHAVSRGQRGLIAARLSLANRFRFDQGLEGGISWMSGERISKHAVMRSPGVAAVAKNDVIETRRVGVDARLAKTLPGGTFTWTTELSIGRDEQEDIFTQLYQVEYLRSSRRWGAAMQYRRFYQDLQTPVGGAMMGMGSLAGGGGGMAGSGLPGTAESSIIAEVTRYYRFSPGNDNLHWVKLNVESKRENPTGPEDTIYSVQYYRYW